MSGVSRRVLGASALLGLLAASPLSAASDTGLEEAPSISDLGIPTRSGAIRFSDRQAGDTAASLTPFATWSRTHPDQKRLLALHPGYIEPTVTSTVDGLKKTREEKLDVYVAGARMLIDRPPARIDLGQLASTAALARIDPAIRHRAIAKDEATPNRDPEQPYNRLPDRAWCEPPAACFESRYDLEGKLPLGIRLANKMEEGGKKIAEHITFQSEIRVLSPAEIGTAGFARLTGLSTPVVGALEQSTFQVNQILRFGKLLAIVQASPSDPGKSVVSVYFVLAVKADVLSRKKEYERVPVLRNLVPAQVLMGTSSFNTGNSLSAGLPAYARGRARTLAALLGGP